MLVLPQLLPLGFHRNDADRWFKEPGQDTQQGWTWALGPQVDKSVHLSTGPVPAALEDESE